MTIEMKKMQEKKNWHHMLSTSNQKMNRIKVGFNSSP